MLFDVFERKGGFWKRFEIMEFSNKFFLRNSADSKNMRPYSTIVDNFIVK